MRKPADPSELGFTHRDRQRLARALRDTDSARLFRRLQAVLLVAERRAVPEVARITGLGQSTIYSLRDQYLHTHQVTSLEERERPGRPRVAPEVSEARILRELQRLPLRLGYRTNVWTVPLLAAHLNERYGSTISPRTLRRRMRDLGLRCKRPRYVYAEKERHLPPKKGRLSGG
jgi:transposase